MVPDFKGRGDLLENIYKGYQMAQAPEQMAQQRRQADLNSQLTQEQVTGARYANKIAPENQAASLANLQAQTRGQQLQNQYLPKNQAQQSLLTNAQIQASQANTGLTKEQTTEMRQSNARMQAFNALLAGFPMGAQGGQQQVQPPMASSAGISQPAGYQQGQGALNPQAQQMTGQPMQQQMQPQQQGSLVPGGKMLNPGNPAMANVDAVYVQHPEFRQDLEKMGYKGSTTTNVDPTTGAAISTTKLPSGASYTFGGATQEDAAQKGIEEGIVESNKQGFIDINKETQGLYQNQQAIDSIRNSVTDPDFVNAVGPANSWYESKLGKGAAADLYGSLQTNSNTLVAKMQKQEGGGKGSVALLRVLQSSKPSPNDPPAVLVGKVNALNSANRWNTEFNNATIKNMKNGMDYNSAMQEAFKQVPTQKYADEAENYIRDARLAAEAKQMGYTISYEGDVPEVQVTSETGNTGIIPASMFHNFLKSKKK